MYASPTQSTMADPPLLALSDVRYRLGGQVILDGVELGIAPGERLSLVGRNGAGKSTVMKTAIGLLRCTHGRCRLDARDVTALGPHRRSRLGIAYVPEDRQIFANLTVDENLALAEYLERPGRWARQESCTYGQRGDSRQPCGRS